MKASLNELLMLGYQFVDGDTYRLGKKIRRGQYYGTLESVNVNREGIHVVGLCNGATRETQVSMDDIVDQLNDFRIKNIRLMWDGQECVGQYEGRLVRDKDPFAVAAQFGCTGIPDYIEGSPEVDLYRTHKIVANKAKFAIGYDGPGQDYVFLCDVELHTGHYFVCKRYKELSDIKSEDAEQMLVAILPGLAGSDVREESRYVQLYFAGQNLKPQPLWEFFK